ncbi:MAG: PocR ligand-binding domain-containing protein [Lachnospiraceae bacterium]|nr:PocR ligand-binding domain-containing protein [Lachnospiraceae bacterium]
MYISTNKQELLQLAQNFYNITHTLISIFDEKENLICSYPKNMCEFCTEIRKSKELTAKCFKNDEEAFKKCKATKKTYIYHCHMGLIEVATPIIYNNVILGYMLFGQITDCPDKTALLSNIEKVVQQYSVDESILTSGLMKISHHTDEYIQSIAKLLEMCANYIWLNSIISIKKEGMSFSIDLYIKEHIKDDLSIPELCRQFNIGRSTLYEIAKNNFGCSINEYIQNYRNECAKELLQNKGISISQVADRVGFKDVNYFIRFFKKKNGCTPKAYQKNYIVSGWL